jgi:hypothetical protein
MPGDGCAEHSPPDNDATESPDDDGQNNRAHHHHGGVSNGFVLWAFHQAG